VDPFVLLQEDFGAQPPARRRRKARIANVVPGPRPGLCSGVVKHFRVLWLNAVDADQATDPKLHL
jgi:hypothetical protein